MDAEFPSLTLCQSIPRGDHCRSAGTGAESPSSSSEVLDDDGEGSADSESHIRHSDDWLPSRCERRASILRRLEKFLKMSFPARIENAGTSRRVSVFIWTSGQ